MNWYIVFNAAVFGLCEASYFGWNRTPHSDAEMICEGIAFLIFSLAFINPKKEKN